MAGDPIIRPYRSADRSAVRRICCETGDRGDPVESLYSDRELVADIVTRYYTDFEPDCSWVAEVNGSVAGYLTGALSTRRYARVMARRIVAPAALRALLRGALLRAETWRMLRSGFRNLRNHGRRFQGDLDRFPAHIHINLLPDARGRGMGRQLLRAFSELAASRAVAGVHVTVRADHPRGIAFFRRMGFAEIGGFPIVLPARGGVLEERVIIYARSLPLE